MDQKFTRGIMTDQRPITTLSLPGHRRASWRALAHIALATALTGWAGAGTAADGGNLAAALAPGTQGRGEFVPARDCSAPERTLGEGPTLAERQLALAHEFRTYQALTEEALAMRAKAIQLALALRAKEERHEPLSGQELQRLSQGADTLLGQRAALLRIAVAHECWLNDPIPSDPAAARLQWTGIAMSLSAALVLYDNYLLAVSLYQEDSKLRRHLNRSDRGYALQSGEIDRASVSFSAPGNRQRVREALKWFEAHGNIDGATAAQEDRYLTQLIEQSPSRHIVRQVRPLAFLNENFKFLSALTGDSLLSLKNEGVNISSLLFGNTIGLVESRRGKLDGRASVLASVANAVRAGDILLEKTPFRLTDTFIPGHWGHAAIWVGNEAELRQLGIWDHPVVRPHHDEIVAGRGVVEALRSGVQMNPLANFLNVDDLAVLRQNEIDDRMRAQVIVQALRQVGKAYDFNFDIESTDRIVCSELVYHAYTHLEWPTERHLGRATISPDNVAVRATGSGPLTIAVLYHDGNEVVESPPQALAKLVQPSVIGLARR
jgi:uncharacterized protein YycO